MTLCLENVAGDAPVGTIVRRRSRFNRRMNAGANKKGGRNDFHVGYGDRPRCQLDSLRARAQRNVNAVADDAPAAAVAVHQQQVEDGGEQARIGEQASADVDRAAIAERLHHATRADEEIGPEKNLVVGDGVDYRNA
ncbi:MAG TPA: hypothetical protein VNJ04_07305 [Gemmatimonadaceae bacterium]|nr:hypothetical protein [Gemmatimonadaceae bacterium]